MHLIIQRYPTKAFPHFYYCTDGNIIIFDKYEGVLDGYSNSSALGRASSAGIPPVHLEELIPSSVGSVQSIMRSQSVIL